MKEFWVYRVSFVSIGFCSETARGWYYQVKTRNHGKIEKFRSSKDLSELAEEIRIDTGKEEVIIYFRPPEGLHLSISEYGLLTQLTSPLTEEEVQKFFSSIY